MKAKIISLVVGLILGSAGIATAATSGMIWNGNTACQKYKRDGFACVEKIHGWGVGISGNLVMVQRPNGTTAYSKYTG